MDFRRFAQTLARAQGELTLAQKQLERAAKISSSYPTLPDICKAVLEADITVFPLDVDCCWYWQGGQFPPVGPFEREDEAYRHAHSQLRGA